MSEGQEISRYMLKPLLQSSGPESNTEHRAMVEVNTLIR